MISAPSMLPSPSLLIEQLRRLEAQFPVRVASHFNKISLTQKQPPGRTVSPASSSDNAAVANQILTNARSLREVLAAESTEASRKLSDAVLDVVLYTEKLESIARLLALADTCIGQIRSRMCANSISIRSPSTSSSAATESNSVIGPVVSGKPVLLKRPHVSFFSHPQMYQWIPNDVLHTRQDLVSTSCQPHLYIIKLCFFCFRTRFLPSVLASMVRPSPTGEPPPAPPAGLLEYLAFLSQNNPALLSTLQAPSVSSASTPTPPAPSQPRSFSRPNRGTGGALVEKQKISKEIKAPATKRKTLVDVPVEDQVLPAPENAEGPTVRQVKRPKTNKVIILYISNRLRLTKLNPRAPFDHVKQPRSRRNLPMSIRRPSVPQTLWPPLNHFPAR
jgi:hypothetical protein